MRGAGLRTAGRSPRISLAREARDGNTSGDLLGRSGEDGERRRWMAGMARNPPVALSALYFLNLRGDVILERQYRDDVE